MDSQNYVTKSDLKGVTVIDTWKFTKNVELISLKSKVDIMDVDKLETVLTHLSKLSNVVKNYVIKNTTNDEKFILLIQAKIPDTNTFLKTQEWQKHRKTSN